MTLSLTGEELILQLTAVTEIKLHDHSFGVSELAREMGFSRSTLHRKMNEFFHCSCSRFICQSRLKRACQLLCNQEISIKEVAFECGFKSITYFDKCFKEQFDMSPGEFRKRSYEKSSLFY